MRTTIDIDDDILLAVRERAARERKSFGAVLSTLARDALRSGSSPTTGDGSAQHGGATGGRFAVLPKRAEIVTLDHVRRLQDAESI